LVDGSVLGENGDGEGGIGGWRGVWVWSPASDGAIGVAEDLEMVEGID